MLVSPIAGVLFTRARIAFPIFVLEPFELAIADAPAWPGVR
jgi:hypothetical protein